MFRPRTRHARTGWHQPADDFRVTLLPRRWSEDADDLAGPSVEIDAVEHGFDPNPAVADNLEQRRGRHAASPEVGRTTSSGYDFDGTASRAPAEMQT